MSEYSRTGVYGMQIWNVEKSKGKLDVVDDTQFRENGQLDGSPVKVTGAANKYPYVSVGEWSCN